MKTVYTLEDRPSDDASGETLEKRRRERLQSAETLKRALTGVGPSQPSTDTTEEGQ